MERDEFLQKIMAIGAELVSEVKEKGEIPLSKAHERTGKAREIYDQHIKELHFDSLKRLYEVGTIIDSEKDLRIICFVHASKLVQLGLEESKHMLALSDKFYEYLSSDSKTKSLSNG